MRIDFGDGGDSGEAAAKDAGGPTVAFFKNGVDVSARHGGPHPILSAPIYYFAFDSSDLGDAVTIISMEEIA